MSGCKGFVQRFLEFTIGNLFGKDVTCREPVHPCDRYQPGSLVDIGRTAVKLFKKFLVPGGLCGAVPIIKPVPPSPETPVDCSNNVTLIRPSQLPLYVKESSIADQAPRSEQDSPPSFLEEGFGTVRRSLQGVIKEYVGVTDTVKNTINTGIAHSQSTLDYLREEENSLPRVGAVAIGALTGLIFSLRGGKFKRLVYTAAGASSIGAICYPKEAKDTLVAAKHYINIGYNFIYGVKPGDANQLEIIWPELPKLKIPSSLSELVDLASAAGAGAAAAVTSITEKATDTIKSQEDKPNNVPGEAKKN